MIIQNHAQVKDLLIQSARRTKGNRTNTKKPIELVLDSTLQITTKKLPFVKFWHSSKENYPQFPGEN